MSLSYFIFIVLVAALLQICDAKWVQYQPCYIPNGFVDKDSNVTCFLPNSFLQNAVTLDFQVYVDSFYIQVVILSQPNNGTLFSYQLWIHDNDFQASVTSAYFSNGVLIVICNTSDNIDSLYSLSVSAYYYEVWQMWQLWLPIGLVLATIIIIINISLCFIRRKRRQQSLRIHSINEMIVAQDDYDVVENKPS